MIGGPLCGLTNLRNERSFLGKIPGIRCIPGKFPVNLRANARAFPDII